MQVTKLHMPGTSLRLSELPSLPWAECRNPAGSCWYPQLGVWQPLTTARPKPLHPADQLPARHAMSPLPPVQPPAVSWAGPSQWGLQWDLSAHTLHSPSPAAAFPRSSETR